MTDMALGYLVFEVSRPDVWREFAIRILGCQLADVSGGEACGLRVDDRAYRLLLRQGKADDLAVLGWTMKDETSLRALADRLAAAGVATEAFSATDLAARQVMAGLRFRDPMGLVNEAVVGLPEAATPFASDDMPGGFCTGEFGLGHAVLATGRQAAAMEDFYMRVVGLALTERIDTKIGPIKVDGSFLHCNRRHHSLALIAIPSRKRLLHFMLQVNRLRDVGIALQRARAAGIRPSLDLGQHPDPDGTVSFYAPTPSGFDFEIGAGSGAIDPSTHQTEIKTVTSDWGHKPSLRMQLRGAIDMIADKFRKAA
ncbi:VOC family protein [Ferrovibrio terrae]|uniref:VOC family protein n=1 Tax=Ferrovibrio terrae TaxID=2594003 RepID=UPI0031384190